jgi:hypothetical protein
MLLRKVGVVMENKDQGVVVSFADFKNKKIVADNLSRGRQPLYVSHLEGKISCSPNLNSASSQDFADRMQRIKSSLEKINRLMAELKKVSKEDENSNT